MKLKRLISALVSGVMCLTAISSLSFITAGAEDDLILLDEPVQADKDWGQALTIQGSDLDKSMLKEGCVVYVEYEGNNGVELICQSWPDSSIEGCDKEIWAKVYPDTNADGVASFLYEDIYNEFIVDNETTWDCFMAFHIGVESMDTVINKVYITYEDTGDDSVSEDESKPEADSEADSDAESSSDGSSAPDAPTLSFDMSSWESYLHLTESASTAGISLSTTRTSQYQGATLQLSVDMASDLPSGTFPTYASTVCDDDGNVMYPGAEDENATLINPGFELHAEDFGLETFDGATVTFKYLFNEDAADVLLEGSMFMYSKDAEGEIVVNAPMKATVNTITKENINYYSTGFVTVPADVGATSLVFEIPLMKAYKGTIIMIDNIGIEIGGTKVANVDGYNDTAEPTRESDGVLKITGEGGSTSSESSSAAEDKGPGFNPIIIVVIVFVVAAVALVVIIIIKNKNRYY